MNGKTIDQNRDALVTQFCAEASAFAAKFQSQQPCNTNIIHDLKLMNRHSDLRFIQIVFKDRGRHVCIFTWSIKPGGVYCIREFPTQATVRNIPRGLATSVEINGDRPNERSYRHLLWSSWTAADPYIGSKSSAVVSSVGAQFAFLVTLGGQNVFVPQKHLIQSLKPGVSVRFRPVKVKGRLQAADLEVA
jgi:hypothetical protein